MSAATTATPLAPAERLAEARARFAESLDVGAVEPTLGEIVLRATQLDALRRVRALLRREGGCLLADDVGTGKTYVALAAAREWTRPLVVVPASLRSTWETAIRRAAVPCAVATHESLSRGRIPSEPFDGVVVDESHRFRPTSRRHAALARLAWRVPLLLLSATPLQNRARELAAQLALFLGELAYGMEPAALTRWIVRTTPAPDDALPTVAAPRWLELSADDGAVLETLLALPPPPRAADVGDGGALLLLSLVRAWASSRAALRATLRRRRRTLVAIEQCQSEGRLPSRRELASWLGDDAVQLGFPSLLVRASAERAAVDRLTLSIEAERNALDALMCALKRGPDPDLARVRALREVRARHDGAAVLVFSEFASTVRAYFSAMRADPGVGMLSAREARIASGRLPRDALLARFAPRAQGAPVPHTRERVTLLLATDLLSEGVNLQDAAVVVHLDLPWNPARLAQRLGRVRRPGGAREVASYLMAPPARAALLLRAEHRLRDKLAQAEGTIGRGLDVLPRLSADGAGEVSSATGVENRRDDAIRGRRTLAVAELRGEVHRILSLWRHARESAGCEHATRTETKVAVAAVQSRVPGWLAALDDGRVIASLRTYGEARGLGGVALGHAARARVPRGDVAADGVAAGDVSSSGVADLSHELPNHDAREVTDDMTVIARALDHADVGEHLALDGHSGARAEACARRAIDEWVTTAWTRRSCGIDQLASPLRRRLLREIDRTLVAAPRHRRQRALEHARLLRAAIAHPLPLGAERALAALLDASTGTTRHGSTDIRERADGTRADDWLARAVELLASRRGTTAATRASRRPEPVAIILLVTL